MAKKTKRQLAAAGTKADPNRGERPDALLQGGRGADALQDKYWYLPAIDPENLSSAERLTRRLFVTVGVMLVLVAVAPLASLLAMAGGASTAGLQGLLAKDPAAAVSLLVACVQGAAVFTLHIAYHHYQEGDAGFTAANLSVLLCAELLLQNLFGIVAMGVLLWRVWKRGSRALGPWSAARGFGGAMLDISPSIVVTALAALCFFAGGKIGM